MRASDCPIIDKLRGPGVQKRGGVLCYRFCTVYGLRRDNTSSMRAPYSHHGRIFKVAAYEKHINPTRLVDPEGRKEIFALGR
jgi:hypothetical protein